MICDTLKQRHCIIFHRGLCVSKRFITITFYRAVLDDYFIYRNSYRHKKSTSRAVNTINCVRLSPLGRIDLCLSPHTIAIVLYILNILFIITQYRFIECRWYTISWVKKAKQIGRMASNIFTKFLSRIRGWKSRNIKPRQHRYEKRKNLLFSLLFI